MAKRWFKRRKISLGNWKRIRERIQTTPLRWDYPAKWLDAIVTTCLKIGTLFLILFLIVFIAGVFKEQGFIIEPFSVPESFDKNGFNGSVIASKIQDEVLELKELVTSVKADSIKLTGNTDGMEFNLSVMGLGVSLNSIGLRIREMFGRKNEIIQGEIIQIGSTLSLTLRMSGYPPKTKEVVIEENELKASIQQLLRKGGEIIMGNKDPYRLAILCYQEERYEEGVDIVREIVKSRPDEIHWAYLAWGSILEEQGKLEESLIKFKRACDLKPDFQLPYVRIAWILARQNKTDESIQMMRTAVNVDPTNVDRYLNLGWMLLNRGDSIAADSFFRQASILEPQSLNVWASWASSKVETGKAGAAKPILKKALQLVKENAGGYMIRAMESLSRGDSLQAYGYLETALDFDPTLPMAIRTNLYVNWGIGDYPKVVRIYEKSDLSEFNKFERQQLLNLAAMSYNLSGDHTKAYETAQKAISIDTTIGYPYSTLGEIYAMNGDIEKFYELLEKAFQLGMVPESLTFKFEPYISLKDDYRFLQLLEKYANKPKG